MKKFIFLQLAILIWFTSYSQKVEWADYVYSTVNFNEGQGIVSDNAGNVYTLGDISDQVIIQGDTFVNQYGVKDLILIKYNPQGNLMWGKVFGSALSDDAFNLSIDAANHLYAEVVIQGTTMMNDTTYIPAYVNQIIQFDTASNFLRYFTQSMGIIADAKGYDVYLAYNNKVEKRDTAFNIIWSRTGSNSNMSFSRGGSQIVNGTIMVGNNGHLAVSGYESGMGGSVTFDTVSFSFSATNTGDELLVISMDTSGSALWAATLDSSNTVQEKQPKVAIDDAGNVYLALYSPGDVMYFANDTLYNIPSSTPYSAVLKYNASGIPQWAIGYYAESYQTYIYDVLINPQQDLLLCGWSAGTGQFGNYTLPAAFGSSTILPYVAKINPAGIIQWYKTDGQDGVGSTLFNRIAMTPNGDYAVTGLYPSSVGFQVPYRLGCFTAIYGSVDILTFVLSENPEPVPVADFNLLFEGGVAYFENTSLNFDTLKWIFGDSQTDNIRRNPSHSYPVPGAYNACVIASNGCGSDTACTSILVAGIEKVTPNRIANTGYHIVKITGGFPFTTGNVKFIKSGEPDIIPDATYFINSGLIKANLKLDSAALGDWDLVIISGSFNDTLVGAITLETPDTFDIEVQISGAYKTLVNTWWPNKILLTNKSNRTEIGVPLYVTISPDAQIWLQYNELNDSITLMALDTIGNFTMQPDTTGGDSVLFGAFLIPYIGPGEIRELNMLVKIQTIGLRTITARLGNSYFDSQNLTDMDLRSSCNFLPPCVQCAMDLAGFIPGAGCAVGAFNLGCAVGNGITGSPGGGALDLIGAAVGTGLSCVAGPVGALAKAGAIREGIAGAFELADLANGVNGVSDDCGGSHGCKPFNPVNWTWPSAGALDPNAKSGPLGLTPENYISGKETMHFYIHFENVDTATAPAREVIIHDTLDASVFNVSTFRFTSFAFGDSTYTLDVQDNLFATDIDLRPAKNIILRVSGFLDTLSNVVTWKFQSFDTLTYDLTLNVNDGFLPPNISRPEGEGYLTYAIEPVQGLPHLQQLKNTATIIFDGNASVITNTFLNTVDDVNPSSQVNANPVFINDTTFILTWSGTDAHAGVNVYDIYVSINNGAYIQLFKGTAKTWARLTGVIGDTYKFYSIVTDLADNRELPPSTPDETVSVINTGVLSFPGNSFDIFPNPNNGTFTLQWENAEAQNITVQILDLSGAVVKKIFSDRVFNKGGHTTIINCCEFSAGTYLVSIQTTEGKFMKKLVITE